MKNSENKSTTSYILCNTSSKECRLDLQHDEVSPRTDAGQGITMHTSLENESLSGLKAFNLWGT